MQTIATDSKTAILGLGITGMSCVRYLQTQGRTCAAFDSAMGDQAAAEFQRQYPQVPLYTGEFNAELLQRYSTLMVSPGISLAQPAIAEALANGAQLSSDIDLFLEKIQRPVVAITGSNGKTTVTTLVGQMAAACGLNTAVGGNIGTPVLDFLLDDEEYDIYVLELSSFQLERCGAITAVAATMLNLSPDHMDRYDTLAAYQRSKQRIYRGCRCAVFNREDKLTWPLLNREQKSISFGLGSPDLNQFGLIQQDGETWLARGHQALLAASEMKIYGQHNQLNALAALALGEAAGFDIESMLSVLRHFSGLAHRCQWLGKRDDIEFFNDSKGTNPGATLAAVNGLSRAPADIVLIAGGQGKGAEFSVLLQASARFKGLILLGEAAAKIAAVMQDKVPVVMVESMADAVAAAIAMASPGDRVLLSPACASFDMFNGYEHRGRVFADLVREHLEAQA
jgi:UDP-N-acetylmuramoylalanine--D-glutamate ligase